MNYLLIGDHNGKMTMRLIERGVDPYLIFVWDDSTKGEHCVKMEGATFTNNLSDYAGMNFDIIIGNPPYQRPKHAAGNHNNSPLWLEFISRSVSLLKPGGKLDILVPGQVAKSTQWSEKGKGFKYLEGVNITHIFTGMEKHFKVGTTISRVVGIAGEPQGPIRINNEFDVDITNRPWLPVVQHPAAYTILDKIVSQANNFRFVLQANGSENKQGHGDTTSVGMYRLNQYYGYECDLRGERKAKNLMWVGMECETEELASDVVRLMRSKLFTAIRRILFYEPNYANGILNGMTYANTIAQTDTEIYEQYGLSAAEISFVESLQK